MVITHLGDHAVGIRGSSVLLWWYNLSCQYLLVLQRGEKMQFYESSFKTDSLTLIFRRAKALLEISMVILFVYSWYFSLESMRGFHQILKVDMTQHCPERLALPSHAETWPPTKEIALEVDGKQPMRTCYWEFHPLPLLTNCQFEGSFHFAVLMNLLLIQNIPRYS